jgi:phosphoglycolate phosphatase-like HAD superfamily hydrolase
MASVSGGSVSRVRLGVAAAEVAVSSVLRSAKYVLMDFDGPICNLFEGRPADRIAQAMRSMLDLRGLLPMELGSDRAQDDPHGLLRVLGELLESQGLSRAKVSEAELVAHEFLAEEEQEAAQTATGTPGAVELIHGLGSCGVGVAIVSNNSSDSVIAYLSRVGSWPAGSDWQQRVFGRPPRPGRMKPDPYLLRQAMMAMDAQPEECLLLGDSATDYLAAEAAGVGFIGFYGGDSERREELCALGVPPGLLVSSLEPLLACVTART